MNIYYGKINVILISFLCFITVFFSDNSINKLIKGDANDNLSSVSPLPMVQEVDSVLRRKYIQVKKMYKEEKYSESLKEALELLTKLNSKNDYELKYLTNFLIGNIFRKRNNHKKALNYYKSSLKSIQNADSFFKERIIKYDKEFGGQKSLANSYLRIGTEYFKIRLKDSAISYFKKIIDLPTLNNDLIPIKASAYTNLSGVYLEDSKLLLAKQNALKAVELHQKNNNKTSEAAALGNLASIYLVEKKYHKAKDIYTRAINLIDKEKDIRSFQYKEDLYFNLAWTLYLLKDYTAYEYQEKSYNIKDTLREREIRRIVDNVFARHKENLEEQKVNLVKNKVELKKLQERKITLLFSVLSLLVLIISGVVIYNYKLRQRNLQLKLSKSELIQQQNIEKIKSESQIKILNATLDGKESERKQIAETLHDSVSSLLSSATLHLQATRTQFNGGTPIEIDKTQAIITEASEKIRDLSHTLVSSVLLKFGLRHAIKDIAEKYSNSAIQIHTDISDVRRYHQGFEIKANNIIQEFINNILKHSKAENAFITMQEKDEALYVVIEDDGQGFNPKEITNKDGLGINQIEARIKMMKGSLKIDSTLGKGTIIKMVLPIVEKEKVNFNLA